jgi:DNA processing protein
MIPSVSVSTLIFKSNVGISLVTTQTNALELPDWLALAKIPYRHAKQVLQRLGQYSLAQIYKTPSRFGLWEATTRYLKNLDWNAVEKDLTWLARKSNHFILTLADPAYPALLREIAIAPLVLYVKGDITILQKPQIAVIGSRNPTPIGKENALQFAYHLSQEGFVITSGMAIGIDTAAHWGALTAKRQTIAVQGTGLDVVYPKRNYGLMMQIAENGALVSEFPMTTPACANHFPRRNRIISGLSLGTLVVEATVRSGSLITAHFAAEQGREVFTIPGSIHNPQARGCHLLIQQGAKLIETTGDIIEELGHFTAQTHGSSSLTHSIQKNLLEGEYLKLLECIDFEPTSIDILVERSRLSVRHISTKLIELELQGYICSTLGGYTRVS